MHVRSVDLQVGAVEGLAVRIGVAALERHLSRPRALPMFTLIAEHRGAIVGHALLAHERRALGHVVIDCASVELVAARDDVHEALLGATVAAATEAGLVWLTTQGPVAELAQYGLAPCSLDVVVELPVSHQNAALRPASLEDAEDMAALISSATAHLPLTLLRAAPDWHWALGESAEWLALEDSRGRVVGCCRLHGGRVIEAGVADAGAARALVLAAQVHGATALALPLAHDVVRAALLLGAAAEVRAADATRPMLLWGVLDLVGGLRELAPELRQRLAGSRYADWSGRVQLAGAFGAATLSCEAQGLSVVEGGGPAEVAIDHLGLAAVPQLLLGYRAAADLRATGELRCADVDLGLINVLFPVV